ncbi:MAG: alpha/beta hydrolase, partial [Mycobacteriales bacterium]
AAGAAVLLGGGAALADHEIYAHPGLRRFFGFCGSTPALPPLGTYAIETRALQSEAMGRPMPYTVALPQRETSRQRLPLVLALPCEGGAATDFAVRQGLPNYAFQAGFRACFVSPGDPGSSYYHPRGDGSDMLAFLLDELIPHLEQTLGVGGSRSRRALYGVSMGGYGALLIAHLHPEMFCAATVGSPAVFQSYQAAITGHPHTFDSEADWQRWGLWDQLGSGSCPAVRIDCGDADPFAPTARELLRRIPGAVGSISSGCHEGGFWRRHAPADIAFLKNRLSSQPSSIARRTYGL